MLAVILDGALSFSSIEDRNTGDFILLYLNLMSTAAFIGLSFSRKDIVIATAFSTIMVGVTSFIVQDG